MNPAETLTTTLAILAALNGLRLLITRAPGAWYGMAGFWFKFGAALAALVGLSRTLRALW